MSPEGEKLFFAENAKFSGWLEALIKEYSVFCPVEKESGNRGKPDYVFKKLTEPGTFCFNPYRAVEPLKSFFTPFTEKVAEYFGGADVLEAEGETVLFGVKGCDLAAHRVQDYVFLEGVEPDSFYKIKRDNIIMASGDCPDFREVCFCAAMGGAPYPESGFDINLSPVQDKGFVVEAGSEKGAELISQNMDCFIPASEEMLIRRDENRRGVSDRMEAHLAPQNLPPRDNLQPLVKNGFESDVWERFALTCVECGACNFVCDTCHCFLLSDNKNNNVNTKTRLWDSCQYKNFARVAGGANPMKNRAERLRNRFLKKFDFFVDNMKSPACCGCGRCIDACPGKIDIREVLKDLGGTRDK